MRNNRPAFKTRPIPIPEDKPRIIISQHGVLPPTFLGKIIIKIKSIIKNVKRRITKITQAIRLTPMKLKNVYKRRENWNFKDLLLISVGLGSYFLLLQGFEYGSVPFHINDTVFGAIFFLLTGLHGLHVMVGIIFLSFCYIRFTMHATSWKNLSLHFAAWYWHFVDVVWILLYIVIYLTPYLSIA
jgi:Cytochrome c oxidase subunit III